MGNFLASLQRLVVYCKTEFEEYPDNSSAKCILNETIVLIGYIGLNDLVVRKRIAEAGLLEEVFNMPIQYIMDAHLRDIVIPTICSLVYQNKTALTCLLKDNSPQQIVKYLKKEIQAQPALSRKASTTSLVSHAMLYSEHNNASYEAQKLSLQMRFPRSCW